jgi:hypothetical protein
MMDIYSSCDTGTICMSQYLLLNGAGDSLLEIKVSFGWVVGPKRCRGSIACGGWRAYDVLRLHNIKA